MPMAIATRLIWMSTTTGVSSISTGLTMTGMRIAVSWLFASILFSRFFEAGF